MTLPIVVYTSETARLIMALKRNETKWSSTSVEELLKSCPDLPSLLVAIACRADNVPYRHDRRADKNPYRHDRNGIFF